MKKLLSLLVMAATLLSLGGCFWFGPSDAISYENSERYGSGVVKIEGEVLGKNPSLDIEWLGGSVTVIGHEKSTFEVSESNSTDVSHATTMRTYFDGSTFFVRPAAAGASASEVPPKQLYILLPAGIELGDVTVRTTSADVGLADLNAEGVRMETDSGSLQLRDSYVDELICSSDSGDISASPIGEPVAVRVTTVSGGVDVMLPKALGFTLKYITSSGELINGYAESIKDGMLTVGDGKATVRVNTDSGNLYIGKQDR